VIFTSVEDKLSDLKNQLSDPYKKTRAAQVTQK